MESYKGFVRRGFEGKSGFAFWKYRGLFSQTSELLLCSSSLEDRGKKSRGKVPVTSFLRPHWGLRRGRARFLWKHQEGLGTAVPRLLGWGRGAEG